MNAKQRVLLMAIRQALFSIVAALEDSADITLRTADARKFYKANYAKRE